MLSDYLIAPSINSLFITGIILLFIIIIFVKNFKKFINSSYYTKITVLALISNAIGMHGLLHYNAELIYDLNPYKWINV
jgi:hypothetical protein